MSTEQRVFALRGQVALHLQDLQQLTARRNLLLHLAVHNPRPAVARALRCNRRLADAARWNARLARARLAALDYGHAVE